MKTCKDETTRESTPNAIELFRKRLVFAKRLLDAFPGPLQSPLLLREVADAGDGDVEAIRLSGVVVVGLKGDSPFCDLKDDSLSRRHFRILAHRNGRCYAEDLGSTNGLWINGRKVSHRLLVHGDLIHAGNQDWVFHDGKGAEPDEGD